MPVCAVCQTSYALVNILSCIFVVCHIAAIACRLLRLQLYAVIRVGEVIQLESSLLLGHSSGIGVVGHRLMGGGGEVGAGAPLESENRKKLGLNLEGL